MGKKLVLVLKASPRKHGNSSFLADQAIAGAADAGASVETYNLHEMDIQPCSACDACQKGQVDDCIIEDDMAALYPRVRQADAILISGPIYWFTINAQTKLFIDRLYAGYRSGRNDLAGKKIGIILTYGDVDPYKAGAVNAFNTFKDMFNFVEAELCGIVYGTANDPGDTQKQDKLIEDARKLGSKLAQ